MAAARRSRTSKIDIASILTVILVLSSVTVQLAPALHARRPPAAAPCSGSASRSALGLCFLGLQLYDYSQLGFGLKDGPFGTLFYVMTGIHMAHVVGGVVFLVLVLSAGRARAASRPNTTTRCGRARSTGTSSTSCGSACSPSSTC